MTVEALIVSIVWTLGAAYAVALGVGLVRDSTDPPMRQRTMATAYRILLAKAVLYLLAGLVSLVVPPGTAWVRLYFASTFILSEWLLILLLNRAAATRGQLRELDEFEARQDEARDRRQEMLDLREEVLALREQAAKSREAGLLEREEAADGAAGGSA